MGEQPAAVSPQGPTDPSRGVLPPAQALPAQPRCFQNGRALVTKRSNFPGHQPLKEALGPRPPSVPMQSLGASCTCPPPANNILYMDGQIVVKQEFSWAWFLLRKPDKKGWGQGLWPKPVHLRVTSHLGVGISGKMWLGTFPLVADGGTLWDHWDVLGCRPPG